MPIRRAFCDGRFGQIHYRAAFPEAPSAKTPVLLLHMSPKSGRSFERTLAALMEDRLAVAPDYPGYGDSDRPPEDPPVSIADYAEAVWAVADALGLEEVDLAGLHTGALVALEAARQRPDQTRRLALVSAPLCTPSELAEFRAFFEPIPLDPEGTRFRIMWERIARFAGPDMSLEAMAASFCDNQRGGEAYEWGHRAAFDYIETELASALAREANRIVVFNAGDELFEATARARALLAPERYRERPEWGHGFLDARAGEFAAALRAVFDGD